MGIEEAVQRLVARINELARAEGVIGLTVENEPHLRVRLGRASVTISDAQGRLLLVCGGTMIPFPITGAPTSEDVERAARAAIDFLRSPGAQV